MIIDSIPTPILILSLLAATMLLGFLAKPKVHPDKPRSWDRRTPATTRTGATRPNGNHPGTRCEGRDLENSRAEHKGPTQDGSAAVSKSASPAIE
jgi:hypothetical protein